MYRNFQNIPDKFLDSLENPVAVLTDSFTFGFVNRAFSKLFKKERNDITDSSVGDVFESVDLSELLPEIERALSGDAVTFNYKFRTLREKHFFCLHFYPQYNKKDFIDGVLLHFKPAKQEADKENVASGNTYKDQANIKRNSELSRLKEVEKMFNIIAEYSNDFIYITDMDQNFTYLSPSVEKFLGYSLPESYNLHVKDIMTEESYNYQLNLFKNHLEQFSDNLTNVRAIDKIEQVRKDGTKFWSETSASLILDENNNPAGIFGIARDITAQKKKEESLEKKSEYFKLLADYAADMIFVLDCTDYHKFNYVSPSIKNILGYNSEEIYSLSVKDLLTKQSYRYQKQIINDRLNKSPGYSNLTKSVELQLIHKDGSIIWGESHARITANDRGEPDEIIGILRDITERKKAEKRDKEYQNNLLWLSKTAMNFLTMETEDAIYDYIGTNLSGKVKDAIIIVNKINETNDSITVNNVYGISQSIFSRIIDILGINPVGKNYPFIESLKSLYEDNKIMEFNGDLSSFSFGYFSNFLLKQVQKLIDFKKIYTIGLKRQNHWYALVHIFKLKTPELEERNLLETFLNQASIALQRKIMENQWFQAKEAAEKSDRLKTAFLTNMSHEIRSPLNIIMGYIQMLEETTHTTQEKSMYIESIKHSSGQLLRIIDNILLIAKIETGQFEPLMKTFNLKDLVELIFDEYNPVALEGGISFHYENVNESQDILIYSDFDKIKQILEELLDNAFKFTKQGEISFGFKSSSDKIQFYVKDSGTGIQQEYQDSVFDNFYQVDGSNTRNYEGTGLGLSIAKALVEILGGNIWFNSLKHKGTTTFFTIPLNSSE